MHLRPETLATALQKISGEPDWTVIAGGTDHYPARVNPGPLGKVLDISAIPDLQGITRNGETIRIGATTTWTDLMETALPPAFDGLKAAAASIGGVQIQNRGTIAGNLCNASPAADSIPPLLALNASVVLASLQGERILPLPEFITGYRQTARAADELVTAILIPHPEPQTRSGFLKLGARHYLVISIAMVAGVMRPAPDGRIVDVALAIGACSATAQRLSLLESDLVGADLTQDLTHLLRADHFADLSPIDDVRASASYRRDAAKILVGRLLNSLSTACSIGVAA